MEVIIDTQTVSDAGFNTYLNREISTTRDENLVTDTRYVSATDLVGGTIGSEGILYLGSKQIKLDGKNRRITLKGGDIVIEDQGGLTINDGGDLTINNGGDLGINDGGNIIISDGGDVSINSGGNIEINNGGGLSINNGGDIAIKDGGNLKIENGGELEMRDTSNNLVVSLAYE